MKCPRCGKSIPDRAFQCPYCNKRTKKGWQHEGEKIVAPSQSLLSCIELMVRESVVAYTLNPKRSRSRTADA